METCVLKFLHILKENWQGFLVAITALHLIAISLTTFRLWFRYKRRRLWMDDYTAIPPLVFNIINTIVIWMMYVEKGEIISYFAEGTQWKPLFISGNDSKLKSKVALYWLMSIPWYTIIWCARYRTPYSLLQTILLLGLRAWAWHCLSQEYSLHGGLWGDVPGGWLSHWRRFTLELCAGFSQQPATPPTTIPRRLLLISWTVVLSEAPLPSRGLLVCELFDGLPIAIQLQSDTASAYIGTCVFLFVAPLVMLAALPLSRGQRIQVFTLLGSGTLVLVSAVTFCVFQYSHTISGPGREVVIGMVSQIEVRSCYRNYRVGCWFSLHHRPASPSSAATCSLSSNTSTAMTEALTTSTTVLNGKRNTRRPRKLSPPGPSGL